MLPCNSSYPSGSRSALATAVVRDCILNGFSTNAARGATRNALAISVGVAAVQKMSGKDRV